MSGAPTIGLDEPPAGLRYRRRLSPGAAMAELWQARGLIRTLVERDLRVRYKRTFLGIGWALVSPVMFMVVFTFFFEKAAHIATGGVPYALFSYVALVPWNFFAQGVSSGSGSLLSNMALMNKVYCPREVFPIASLLTAAFDTLVSAVILGVLFLAYGYAPGAASGWLPVILIVEIMFTLGMSLFAAGTIIYLRDLRYLVPLGVQLGMFVSPVVYGITVIPKGLRPLYALLDPMGPVLDSIRRTSLHNLPPEWGLLGLAAISSTAWVVLGYWLFKRLETGFADIA